MSPSPVASGFSRNASLMAVGTVLSRVTGFGRLLTLLYVIGAQQLADTYNLANTVPNVVYELIVGGVLSATLVPVFVRELTTRNDEDAWRAISAIVTATLAVLVLATLLVLAFAPAIIQIYTLGSDSFDQDQVDAAAFLLRLFAPQIVFYGLIGLATGLLHARRRFAPPMFAPICNNVAVICMLLLLRHVSSDIEANSVRIDTPDLLLLGCGTTAGVVAMFALLVPYVRAVGRGHFRLHWELRNPAVVNVLRLSGWTVGFVLANQIAFWVSTVLATRGEDGDLTAFMAAYTLFILPHGVLAVSIMSAIQPELAEKWSLARVDVFRQHVSFGLRVLAMVMLPAAAGYALVAEPFTSAVLAHGEVGTREAENTGQILLWMVLGLPGFSAFIYFTRVFQSMQDARTVFTLYVIENGINVVTAVGLYRLFGIDGLALSQTVAYTTAAVFASVLLRRRMRGFEGRPFARAVSRIVAATTLMTATVWLVLALFDGDAIRVTLGAIAGVTTYMLSLWLFDVKEWRVLVGNRAVASETGTSRGED